MNERPLSANDVGAAALRLIDAAGPSTLSLEAVASELGVAITNVEAHASGRNELIDLACDHIYAEVDLRPLDVPWPDRMRTYSRSYRQALLRHPRGALLVATRAIVTISSMAVAERALTELLDVGFSPDEANRVLLVIVAFVNGHALNEIGQRNDDLGGHSAAEVASFRSSLPAGELPLASQTVSHVDRDAEFELGLKLIIDGLERNRLHGAP